MPSPVVVKTEQSKAQVLWSPLPSLSPSLLSTALHWRPLWHTERGKGSIIAALRSLPSAVDSHQSKGTKISMGEIQKVGAPHAYSPTHSCAAHRSSPLIPLMHYVSRFSSCFILLP